MGVDHGGGNAGDKSLPRIWSRGTLTQIVPLGFLLYKYKKARSVAFKIRQNQFSATPLGELTTLPRTPSAGEGTSSPYPTPLGTDPTSALAMRPLQNCSQIYAYARELCQNG